MALCQKLDWLLWFASDADFARDVKAVFLQYAGFSGSKRDDALDSNRFARLCTDAGFISLGLDRAALDRVFAQVAGTGRWRVLLLLYWSMAIAFR